MFKPAPPHPLAFTVKYNRTQSVIVTHVEICIPNSGTRLKVNAIWDTGATGSAITTNVINKLGLIPTGMVQVHTANGVVPQPTFIIDIGLPNRVIVQDITATGVDALSGGCDVLIGMDVINLGDFSITNHNGKTCMSFRMPSCHEVDYVNDFKAQKDQSKKAVIPKVSRNSPCPCGSGKKYKNCHGK
jgi:hypothetical protein